MTRKKIELSPENKQKVEQQFKPFTKLSSLAISKIFEHELCQSDIKVFLYLSIIDPFGDRWIDLPPTKTISDYLGISQSTFYRAISKLSEKEIIKIEDKGFRFKNNMPTAIPTDKDESPPTGNNPHSQGTILTDEDQSSNIGINPHSQENRASKPRQDKGFSDSQTSSDFLKSSQTLSDSVQEGQKEDKSISREEEGQERGVSNFEEEEIKKAIEDSLPLDKEFDNQQLAEQNYHLTQQNYSEQPNHNFPVCRTPINNTENPTTPISRGRKDNVQEPNNKSKVKSQKSKVNNKSKEVDINNKECPKSYEECPQEFIEWKAKDWANYFGYSLTKAHQNLKRCLRKPEKIKEYWQNWLEMKESTDELSERLVEVDGEWITVAEYDKRIESRKPKNDEEIPVNSSLVNLIDNFLNAMRGKPSYAT